MEHGSVVPGDIAKMEDPEKGPSAAGVGRPVSPERPRQNEDLVGVSLNEVAPHEKSSVEGKSATEEPSQEAPPPPKAPWRRRARVLWPGIAFVTLCVIVVIIVVALRLHAPGPQADGRATGSASGASSGGTPVVPLRIMPLGASITSGVGSSDEQGYRPALRGLLRQHNSSVPFAFVGSRATNGSAAATPALGDNEGWPGLTIDQVSAKAASAVPTYKPNLVLVNLGTNDCIRQVNVSTAHVRMRNMLESVVWAGSPRAAVVMSTLLLNKNKKAETSVELYNGNLVDMVEELQALGRPIVLVEMHNTDGPQVGDLSDNVHPNNGGYAKMAAIWFRGISEAKARGFLLQPEYVDFLDDGTPDGGGSHWEIN